MDTSRLLEGTETAPLYHDHDDAANNHDHITLSCFPNHVAVTSREQPSRRRPRVAIACAPCAEAKLKCDAQRPCQVRETNET